MSHYLASEFFNLSTFKHAALFAGSEPVWMALGRIKEFLLSQPLGEIEGHVEQGAFLVNPEMISIGKGTVVEPGAYIKGPCIIGENCQIRHGAYIRGALIAGNDCVIGHATEVKNAIFLDGAKAGHFAYIGDSILGNRVNLGAGTKCANLRFDGAAVSIRDGEKRVDSGLRKLGAIFGDDSQTGCNAVTNPGTLVGKQSVLGPCVNGRGVSSPG
ncbi:MAG: Bifunctional protein GlmU [Chlamydiales bacterium]|nr:Bifunctional protein GlmU [Chlamydiales bacterium]